MDNATESKPRTFEHMGNVREIAFPELSDVQMAGKVRMLTQGDWMSHELVVCGARDRILSLSQENERLKETIKQLESSTYSLMVQAARSRFEDPAQLTQEQADAIDEAAKRETSKIKGKQLPARGVNR